jgi:murein DD-endopeptidase MepM/ murein hydrolase activator NlpD
VESGSTPVTTGATAHDPARAEADGGEPAGETLEVKVNSGDSLDSLFRRNGLSVTDLANMLRIKEAKKALALIKPGDRIEFVRDGEDVISLSRQLSEDRTLRVVRADEGDGYEVEFLTNPVERRRAQAHGKIATSLFEAGADVGLSDTLIMNLAGIFAWDIDFALEIREGDTFSVVYEEIWQDERRLRDGEILAAEFVNQGRVFRALRFEDPEGRVDYYTPEGLSVRKAFLRAPVDFTRVSSNFNPNRLHPVLKTRRPHRGVDYAAPKGTPIKAAGDGRIIFRGRNGGYGNCVIIQHGGNVTTLYAHLSKFARSAPKGRRIRQGQVIGFVGSTGLATAAHLHYEYRLNGVHRNPRTVTLPEAEPVPKQFRIAFREASGPLVSHLDAISPTRLARIDSSGES